MGRCLVLLLADQGHNNLLLELYVGYLESKLRSWLGHILEVRNWDQVPTQIVV